MSGAPPTSGLKPLIFTLIVAVSLYVTAKVSRLDHQFNLGSSQFGKIRAKASFKRPLSSRPSLRFDWADLEPKSELAKRISQHQNDCSLPIANFQHRNQNGLGSDLHVWSQGLCNAMEAQLRIRSLQPWTFWDEEACAASMNATDSTDGSSVSITAETLTGENFTVSFPDKSLLSSSLSCYFPHAELHCPGDIELALAHPKLDSSIKNLTLPNGELYFDCPSFIFKTRSRIAFRTAAMEFLFGSVSPILVREAERQLSLIFGEDGVPENMITVHIRWGDKIAGENAEMPLVPISKYLQAINSLLAERAEMEMSPADDDKQHHYDKNVNIFLATEDPRALKEFQEAVPSSWKIFVDQYYTEMLPNRIEGRDGNPMAAKLLHGKGGLIALGSLLVALEANNYILVTGSNWSRLINELRRSVVDPRCNNCTRMIDLKKKAGWRQLGGENV